MRRFPLYQILPAIMLGFLWTAFIPAKPIPPLAPNTDTSVTGAMEEFVEQIEGIWVNEQRDTELEEPDMLWVEVQREWICRNQVWIKVSEYCQPGIAEYLVFELIDNKLQYVAAIDRGIGFPLIYLDFMELSYEIEDGETILYLESCEAEMQNHLNRRLTRIENIPVNPTSIL